MTERLNCVNGKQTKGIIHSPLDLVQGSLIKLPDYYELNKDDFQIFHADEQQLFVLVVGEKFLVGSGGIKAQEMSGAYIFAVSIGSLLSLQAQDKQVEVIVLNFHPTFNLCLGACPNKVGSISKEAELGIIGIEMGDLQHRYLSFSEGIERWFESVKDYSQNAYSDLFLYELKLQELFRLLNLEYPRTSLNCFIGDIHCKESGFRRRVFALKGTPLSLIELSEYMRMSESILKRRFLTEFGMPPQKWLAMQRSRYIFRDIIQTNTPIKDIAEQYKFSTTSYLSLFCKKYLGDTPQNIRKRFCKV